MLRNKTFLVLFLIFISGVLLFPSVYKKLEKKYQSYQKKELKTKWISQLEEFENNQSISKKINHQNQKQAINYLNARNFFWQEKASVVDIDDKIKVGLENTLSTWNEYLNSVVVENIFQIYFVKNMTSTAKITQLKPKLFAIFINENILQKTPNDWLNEKEKSVINFNDSNYQIKHIIADEENNTPAHLLEIILVHELAHCIGIINNITPDLEGDFDDETYFDFFEEEFETKDLSFRRKNKNIPQLKYYRNQPIAINDYIQVLKILPKTSFPSVYSTVNYLEYFAEYFFTYVHCVEQNRPFKYQIFENDELILTLESGIHLPKNQKKKDFIKAIYNQEK